MHYDYMIALSALFLLIFAVMLHSMIRHRRQQADNGHFPPAATRFGGPQGRSQWLWALVPLLILGVVNAELIRGAASQHSGMDDDAIAKKATIASAKLRLAPAEKETKATRGIFDPDELVSIILSYAPSQLPQPRLQ